jgi:hypothetical protein
MAVSFYAFNAHFSLFPDWAIALKSGIFGKVLYAYDKNWAFNKNISHYSISTTVYRLKMVVRRKYFLSAKQFSMFDSKTHNAIFFM